MSYRIKNQDNCNHFASVKMPGLKNKRECVLCHKIYDENEN